MTYYKPHRSIKWMRLIGRPTDGVAWSVCLSVDLFVTIVSPAKRLNRSRCPLEVDLGCPNESRVKLGPDPYAKGHS